MCLEWGRAAEIDDIVKALCHLTGMNYDKECTLDSFVQRMNMEWGREYDWSFFKIRGVKIDHPATFPIQLAKDMIYTYTEVGMTVYDPFAGSGTTYYMQFTEILRVLRDYTHNNQLKPYNLQTAMRKYGFNTKSVKQSRFDMQPRNMYPVAIIPNDKWLYDRCYKFMDYKLTEEE